MNTLILLFALFTQVDTIPPIASPDTERSRSVEATSDSLALQLTQLRLEIDAAFALYEYHIASCEESKDLIKKRALQALRQNHAQIKAIQQQLDTQQLSIQHLSFIRSQLQDNITTLDKTIKRLNRKLIIERIASTIIITTLSWFLIFPP